MGLKMELFYENAMTISNNEILVKTYFEIFNYMIQKDLSGACHPISTLLPGQPHFTLRPGGVAFFSWL